MRSKESLLNDLKVQSNLTDSLAERQLISVNMYLEVLIDIRDLNQAHLNRLIDLYEALQPD